MKIPDQRDPGVRLLQAFGNLEPARARSMTCRTVASTSVVSVLVIDCTTTGALPPTVTPPTGTATRLRGWTGRAGTDITGLWSLNSQR
jgi:hypothetical protein